MSRQIAIAIMLALLSGAGAVGLAWLITPTQVVAEPSDIIVEQTLQYFAEHPEWRRQYEEVRRQHPRANLPPPPTEEDVERYKQRQKEQAP